MMKTYRKDVSHEEVFASMRYHLEELMKYVKARVKTEPDTPDEPTRTARSVKPTTKSKKKSRTISREQRELLQDILEKPNLGVTSRANRLGLSAYKMNSLKKGLIDMDCIDQFNVNLGPRFGGNVAMLELLPKGYGYLGLEPVMRPENMTGEHWWWQNRLCEHMKKKGDKAEVEKTRNGKRADLGLIKDGKEISVEIEMSPKNAVPNLFSDLKAGFDRVVCCCKDKRTAAEVRRRFRMSKDYEAVKDRVEIRVLTEL